MLRAYFKSDSTILKEDGKTISVKEGEYISGIHTLTVKDPFVVVYTIGEQFYTFPIGQLSKLIQD